MVHKKKLFRKSSVKYGTFSEGPTWSVLCPLCSYKKWKAVINCPKIVACTVNIVKFLVCIISKHSWKAISLMFEIEICGPCLLWKIKWGRGQHGPSGPPCGYAPANMENIYIVKNGVCLDLRVCYPNLSIPQIFCYLISKPNFKGIYNSSVRKPSYALWHRKLTYLL